jgi:FdhD protein
MTSRPDAIRAVTRYTQDPPVHDQDLVAVEAPISLLLHPHAGPSRNLGLLMRTPGHDEDLAVGMLSSEGVIEHASVVIRIETTDLEAEADAQTGAVVLVWVGPKADTGAISDRVGTATSACGLCGRLSMRQIDHLGSQSSDTLTVQAGVIRSLSDLLRNAQHAFAQTGGLHAAAVFTPEGELVDVREDVGRHNAVDKIAGALLRREAVPARRLILAVSGRIAYEIVQKAAMCGLPLIVAVGAPTDLAVDAARACGITLVGFARDGRFNVYTHGHRIANDNAG